VPTATARGEAAKRNEALLNMQVTLKYTPAECRLQNEALRECRLPLEMNPCGAQVTKRSPAEVQVTYKRIPAERRLRNEAPHDAGYSLTLKTRTTRQLRVPLRGTAC
jgi:hypothetical protein